METTKILMLVAVAWLLLCRFWIEDADLMKITGLEKTPGTEDYFFSTDSYGYYDFTLKLLDEGGRDYNPFRPLYSLMSASFVALMGQSGMHVIPFIFGIFMVVLMYYLLISFGLSDNQAVLGAYLLLLNKWFVLSSLTAMSDTVGTAYIWLASLTWFIKNRRMQKLNLEFIALLCLAILARETNIIFLISMMFMDVKKLKKKSYWVVPLCLVIALTPQYLDWFVFNRTGYAQAHNVSFDLLYRLKEGLFRVFISFGILPFVGLVYEAGSREKSKLNLVYWMSFFLTFLLMSIWSQSSTRFMLPFLPLGYAGIIKLGRDLIKEAD